MSSTSEAGIWLRASSAVSPRDADTIDDDEWLKVLGETAVSAQADLFVILSDVAGCPARGGDLDREQVCRGELGGLGDQAGHRFVAGDAHQQLGEHGGERRYNNLKKDDPVATNVDLLHYARVPRCGDTDRHRYERRIGKREAALRPGLDVRAHQQNRSRFNWLAGRLVDDNTPKENLRPGSRQRLLCSGGEGQGLLGDEEQSQDGQCSRAGSDRNV